MVVCSGWVREQGWGGGAHKMLPRFMTAPEMRGGGGAAGDEGV